MCVAQIPGINYKSVSFYLRPTLPFNYSWYFWLHYLGPAQSPSELHTELTGTLTENDD